MREKAKADNLAMHAALAATQHLADAIASRETAIAAAERTVAEATDPYQSALENLVSRIGNETTAELLGVDAITAARHVKRT
jgi:hypothetical protein